MREGTLVKTHQDLIPFMTQSRHMTCVHAAAQLGCVECVRWMVEHIGIHPNEQDKRYGATPLHYAASSGHLKMVKFLLPRVMKVQPDYDGATPLHDAAVQGHMACVQELLKSPLVDPEITDNYGLTAGEWAEQAQEKKCARLLKEAIKKHTATLSKRKKVSTMSKKDKQMASLPAFSQYSDSAGSHSSSPTSETYAQLEPIDCGHEDPPPQLPPRLPDTPRPRRDTTPSSSQQNISKGGSRTKKPLPIPPIVMESSPSRQQIVRTEETDFPPPPDSLLQSLEQELSPPTHQLAQGIKQQVKGTPSSDMIQLAPKPNSQTQHKYSQGGERGGVSADSLLAETSSLMTSSFTSPPVPVYSFSTFKTQEQITPSSFGNTALSSNRGAVVESNRGSETEYQLVTSHRLTAGRQQIPNRQSQHDNIQAVEVADVPDWKRLIQERKAQSSGAARTSVTNNHTMENNGLTPWQNELLRAGRNIPIDIETD